MSRNRTACLAWIPLRVPVVKNRCSPLCRKLRIATRLLVTHSVTAGNPHNDLLNWAAGRTSCSLLAVARAASSFRRGPHTRFTIVVSS